MDYRFYKKQFSYFTIDNYFTKEELDTMKQEISEIKEMLAKITEKL